MASSTSSSSTSTESEPAPNVVIGIPAAAAPQPVRVIYVDRGRAQQQAQPQPQPQPPRTHCCACPPLNIQNAAMLFTFGALLATLLGYVISEISFPDAPMVQVDAGAISNVTFSGTGTVTAECNVTVVFTNTNRHFMTIFDRMEMSLVYPSQDVVLAQYYKGRLVQPGRNRMEVEAKFDFSEISIGSLALEALRKDVKGGKMTVGMKVLGMVRHQGWLGWGAGSGLMRVYCDNLVFRFQTNKGLVNGNMSGPVSCVVYF